MIGTRASPSRSPKSREPLFTRVPSDIAKGEFPMKRTDHNDPKSQFITQMYGTTSVLHPRARQQPSVVGGQSKKD